MILFSDNLSCMDTQPDRNDMLRMLNEWLNHQNMWRQFRFGVLGTWGRNYRFARVCRMSVRAGVSLILFLLIFSFFNRAYFSSEQYTRNAASALEKAFQLQEGSLLFTLSPDGINGWRIQKLELNGGNDSMFDEIIVHRVYGTSAVLSGLLEEWAPHSSVRIGSMSVSVKPGDPDAEEIKEKRRPALLEMPAVKNLTVESLDLRIGKGRTANYIEGAECNAEFDEGRWVFELRGGVIHNELVDNCRLLKARVELYPDSRIEIPSCTIQLGEDKTETLDLQCETSRNEIGAPAFKYTFRLSNVPLSQFVSARLSPGTVEGRFDIQGTIQGLFDVPDSWSAHFRLVNSGEVTLKNIPLMDELSLLIGDQNYRTLICREARFDALYSCRTKQWKAENILFKSDEEIGISLSGELTCRPLTDLEWKLVCQTAMDAVVNPVFGGENENPGSPASESTKNAFLFSGDKNENAADQEPNSVLLTRNTPLIEGKLTLSIPAGDKPILTQVMQDSLSSKVENNCIVTSVPVHEIISEATRGVAQKLQQAWAHSKKDLPEK